MTQSIFNTVPESVKMNVFEGSMPRYDKITEILDLDKTQMSKAVGMAKNNMRFDERMPKELKERLTEIASIIELVGNFFNGDLDKTIMWFRLPNPVFGGISPRNMIRYGRYKKLLTFVTKSLDSRMPSGEESR